MAQNYPARPIRIIALSSPGSGPDIVGRLIGGKLTEAWGQQVIVDPRPAATGIVGSEIASKGIADGGAGSVRFGAWMRPGSGP